MIKKYSWLKHSTLVVTVYIWPLSFVGFITPRIKRRKLTEDQLRRGLWAVWGRWLWFEFVFKRIPATENYYFSSRNTQLQETVEND